MTRPRRLPLLATALQYRTEPVIGQLTTGYPKGAPYPSREAGFFMGYGGDWDSHLDSDRWSLTDDWDTTTGNAVCISTTAIAFTVAGPLQQTPTSGGIYIGTSAARIDASDYANAPLFTFAPSTINYVFLRPSTTRSAYPDKLVQTSAIPPVGQGWEYVYTVTTNVATVTAVSGIAPNGTFYRKGAQRIRGTVDGTVLDVRSVSTFSPAVSVQGGSAALLWLNTASGQKAIQLNVSGSGNYGLFGTAGAGSAYERWDLSSADTVALVADATGGTPGNTLAMYPSASSPAHFGAGPWAAYTRMYARNLAEGGNLRWRDSNGVEFIPMASPGGLLRQGVISGATPVVGSGVANQILVTLSITGTVKQNHWYLIRVECEALATGTFTCAQTVGIFLNAIALSPWSGAYSLQADRDGLQKPWLTTLILYQHTPADVVNPSITLSLSQAVGVSTCTYYNARIAILGGWYP